MKVTIELLCDNSSIKLNFFEKKFYFRIFYVNNNSLKLQKLKKKFFSHEIKIFFSNLLGEYYYTT